MKWWKDNIKQASKSFVFSIFKVLTHERHKHTNKNRARDSINIKIKAHAQSKLTEPRGGQVEKTQHKMLVLFETAAGYAVFKVSN